MSEANMLDLFSDFASYLVAAFGDIYSIYRSIVLLKFAHGALAIMICNAIATATKVIDKFIFCYDLRLIQIELLGSIYPER